MHMGAKKIQQIPAQVVWHQRHWRQSQLGADLAIAPTILCADVQYFSSILVGITHRGHIQNNFDEGQTSK
jgi:hypothetical protein